MRRPVEGDVRSLAWKARTRAAKWLLSGHDSESETDDFDWSRYHLEYGAQISELDLVHTLRMSERDIREVNGVRLPQPESNLHPNHRLLYEFAAISRPDSVLELGCGGGDHLTNIRTLLTDAQISGIDRSTGQLEFLASRNPGVAASVRVFDLTLPLPASVNAADLVYTQAVIMHIQTGNGHRVALWNALNKTKKHLLLIENWSRHDFLSDIRELVASGRTPWEQVSLTWIGAYGARALLVTPGADTHTSAFPSTWSWERIW